MTKKRRSPLLNLASLPPLTLLLVGVGVGLVSAIVAGLMVWLLSANSDWVVWLGLATGVASLILTAFIFVWTANATARQDVQLSNEVVELILGHTTLVPRKETDDGLDAVAKARGFGEGREAIRGALRGVWGTSAQGRAAHLYLIDGPDVLFVRHTRARFTPNGEVEASRIPTDSWTKNR